MEDRFSKIANVIVASSYSSDLAKEIAGTNHQIQGWKSSWEIPGFLIWSHPGKTREIQATPFWKNDREIVVEVRDSDSGDYIGGFSLPLKKTGNLEEDAIAYLKAIHYVWPRTMKLVEMQ